MAVWTPPSAAAAKSSPSPAPSGRWAWTRRGISSYSPPTASSAADASLDATFNNPPFDYGSQEAGRDGAATVAFQSNGQMVAVGGATDPTTGLTDLTLVRYLGT